MGLKEVFEHLVLFFRDLVDDSEPVLLLKSDLRLLERLAIVELVDGYAKIFGELGDDLNT